MLVQATISGVDGAIGSTYNVNGRRARKIFDLARQGQIQEAYQLQHDSKRHHRNSVINGDLSIIEEILRHRGIDAGLPKRPFKPFNEAHRQTLDQLIAKYDL